MATFKSQEKVIILNIPCLRICFYIFIWWLLNLYNLILRLSDTDSLNIHVLTNLLFKCINYNTCADTVHIFKQGKNQLFWSVWV